MRPSFLFRNLAALICWCGITSAANASHILGAELTYEYVGTATNPNQYHVTARLFRDLSSVVDDLSITLTCGKNECGTALPGSFTTTLVRTSRAPGPTGCASAGLNYEISTLEGSVQLSPARWTLSIDCSNRASGVVNVNQSVQMSTYVKALLDNTASLVNSSPRFTTSLLFQLTNAQPQQFSLSAFDNEGDSLTYQLVQPLASSTSTEPCGFPTIGAIAPHFQINAATGKLVTVAGPIQQGRYALAVTS